MVFMQYPQYTAKWHQVIIPRQLSSEQHRWLAEHEGGKCCTFEFPRIGIRFEREEDAIMFRLRWTE